MEQVGVPAQDDVCLVVDAVVIAGGVASQACAVADGFVFHGVQRQAGDCVRVAEQDMPIVFENGAVGLQAQGQ